MAEEKEMEVGTIISQAEAVKAKGTAFFKAGQFDLAIEHYDNILQVLDTDVSRDEEEHMDQVDELTLAAWLNLALCYLKLNRNLDAREACQSALNCDPDSVKGHYRYGQAEMNMGNYENAILSFQTVLEMDTDNKAAKNLLTVAEAKHQEEKKQEKKLYAGMFEKMAAADAKGSVTAQSSVTAQAAVTVTDDDNEGMSLDEARQLSAHNDTEFNEVVDQYSEKEGSFALNVSFNMTQEQLHILAKSGLGKNLKSLDIHNEDYDDDLPVIDFAQVKFPSLESLSTNCQHIATIHFTKENTPQLKALNIEQPGPDDLQYFHTDLPLLETMSFEFVTISDPRQFGPSLSRSPKLSFFSSYKLWGLGVGRRKNAHVLVLPSIESLDLYRSDDLDYISIWAPKMADLNLRACYAISFVQIFDKKPVGYNFGPAFDADEEATPFVVNLINAGTPRGNVASHRRCTRILRDEEEDNLFGI